MPVSRVVNNYTCMYLQYYFRLTDFTKIKTNKNTGTVNKLNDVV